MPMWIIIAALATIGVTAILTGVLYRLNAPPAQTKRRDAGGDAPVLAADGGGTRTVRQDNDPVDGDGADGGDGGGGD